MRLKVLRLLKDLFVNFIPVNRRVSIFSKQDNEVYFQFSFDVGALAR